MTDRKARGSRSRARGVAMGAIAALIVGAAVWTTVAVGRGETIPVDIDDWDTVGSLKTDGWTMRKPPSWRLQELTDCAGLPIEYGVIVTNTDFVFRDPHGEAPQCGDRYVFAAFPRDGVAFALEPGFPRGIFSGLDTALPLAPDLLQQTDGIRGGPSMSYRAIRVDGQPIAIVRRWVGPAASRLSVAALDQLLASIRVRGTLRWTVDEIVATGGIRVSFRRPETWDAATFALLPIEDAPQPILRIASPSVNDGHCPGSIEAASFDSLGDEGAVILVSDATGALMDRDFGRRSPGFRPADAYEDRTIMCGGEIRLLSFAYEESKRRVLVDVAVASSYLREEARTLRHILDSIRVSEI
jgi:hypothetical protein